MVVRVRRSTVWWILTSDGGDWIPVIRQSAYQQHHKVRVEIENGNFQGVEESDKTRGGHRESKLNIS
jgi:hypothetical protein